MILWNELPWNLRANPFSVLSPLHNSTKFSTVLGVVFPNISITISPEGCPPISIEKVSLWVTGSLISFFLLIQARKKLLQVAAQQKDMLSY
jgi:hypothetical protein